MRCELDGHRGRSNLQCWSIATFRGYGSSTHIRINASRHDSRQEPYAVVPHVRICAGGGEQSPSLPRPVHCSGNVKHHVQATCRRCADAPWSTMIGSKRSATPSAPSFWICLGWRKTPYRVSHGRNGSNPFRFAWPNTLRHRRSSPTALLFVRCLGRGQCRCSRSPNRSFPSARRDGKWLRG